MLGRVTLKALARAKLALLVLVLAAGAAHAQTDPGSLERTVPQLRAEQLVAKPPSVDAPALPPQGDADIGQSFTLSAVVIEGATAFTTSELAPSFEPRLASQVGQAELDRIAANITDRYRKAGFLLSYAVVPAQAVQSGIVRIHVVEGFVGGVRLRGDGRAAKAVRGIFAGLASERPLRAKTLERAISLAREVPGALIGDIKIGRSPQNPARHVLTVAVGANRIRALSYSDNRGTVEGARIRGFSSFNLASLAVPGDQLQFDLFAIPYGKFRYLYGQLKGSVPLNADGLRLSASASYGDQFQRVPGPDQNGESRQLAAELSYPFVKSRALSLSGHMQLADWRSEQEQAGDLVQRDRFHVARAWLELRSGTRVRVDGKIGVSRGLDLGNATEKGDALASRPLASAQFTKFNLTLQVAAQLSKRARLRMESAAQFSTAPLLALEEFALGGSRIGRAFDFNEITGDHGLGGLLELAYRLDTSDRFIKSAEFFTYVDGGGAFRDRSLPGLPKEQWLAAAGAGARISAAGMLWSAEIGMPIARSGGDRVPRIFLSATRVF
jgi:hemolysin activation/secretion protein